MNFAALMRIGSLEVVAAFALFAVVVSRWQPGGASLARKPKAVVLGLVVRDAAQPGTKRALDVALEQGTPAIVGRSSQAAAGVLDPEVSRRHARFDLDGGVVYLSDCRSSNGTFLNGNRVGEEGIEVRAGDDIDVGNTRITITKTEPASWT